MSVVVYPVVTLVQEDDILTQNATLNSSSVLRTDVSQGEYQQSLNLTDPEQISRARS